MKIKIIKSGGQITLSSFFSAFVIPDIDIIRRGGVIAVQVKQLVVLSAKGLGFAYMVGGSVRENNLIVLVIVYINFVYFIFVAVPADIYHLFAIFTVVGF